MRGKLPRLLKFALGATVLAAIIYLLGWSNLFAVKQITITGTRATDAISLLLDEGRPPARVGIPLARVDVNVINRELRALDWIEQAEISRNWLHGELTVHIVPRTAVARYLDANGSETYFDALGKTFTHNEVAGDLPIITFTNSSIQLKRAIASLLSQLPAELISQAKAFTAHSPTDLQIVIYRDRLLTIRFGSADEIPLKLRVLNKLMALSESGTAATFDISTPLAPIAK